MYLADCANVIVPQATETAMRYYNSGNVLWIVSLVFGFLVPVLFLWTGFTGKLGTFSAKMGRSWYGTIATYLIAFIAINTALEFPLDYYSGFVRDHAYNLSTQSFGDWIADYGKGFAISIVGALAFVWIFYLLLKRSPTKWWFYGSLVSIGISFFLMFVQPIWIAPLFNKFGPMQNKELEQKILNLASKAGINGARVYEVDMSSQTKTMNAYVTGIGSSKRIVLWDTTINGMTQDQVLFVMGHEMGHYVLNHIWWGLLFFSALTFLFFYLTYRSATYLLNRYHKTFGFKHLYDIASWPLLILLIGIFSFLALPLTNYWTRMIEHNADIFGLEITKNNQAAGEAFVVLQETNLANPRPGNWYKIWQCDHPPLAERVQFCNTYCPYNEGQPLKYGKYFQ